MKIILRLTICTILLLNSSLASCQSKMVKIKGGKYIPLYGRDSLKVYVDDFLMDVYPVTNKEFLNFVKNHPKWQRSKALKLFVDGNYLRLWKSDTILNPTQKLRAPITNVSWFAAEAYCKSKGERLPSVNEWEYVAMANKDMPDARKIASYNEFILAWYEKPRTYNETIGSTFKNYWNVYDLHGLVWEWTSDFSSVLIATQSRNGGGGRNSNLFCGSAAVTAKDLMNYAAFMRYAIRRSLNAKYTMKNLGFRCVKNKKVK